MNECLLVKACLPLLGLCNVGYDERKSSLALVASQVGRSIGAVHSRVKHHSSLAHRLEQQTALKIQLRLTNSLNFRNRISTNT